MRRAPAPEKLAAKEVTPMTLTRKDVSATLLTTLVVLTYAATHEGWGVPLVGDSRRWATGVILLVGLGTCGLGSKVTGATMTLFALLGSLAAALAVLSLWTASLTPLSLLVADIVVLWTLSTIRHAAHLPRRPVATS
jgi:hypothetical protein